MSKQYLLIISLFVVFSSGCSINHPVAKDYDAHLAKYGSETILPTTNLETDYLIENSTKNHSYQFRAATVGYAHVWIVEFGKILDKTLQADYVQSAFGRLDEGAGGLSLIEFELGNYEFKDYRAYTTVNIKVLRQGQEVFNKSYTAEGASQGGQMWIGGPFAMKNATLKSTKSAIDKILEQFISDVNNRQLAAM